MEVQCFVLRCLAPSTVPPMTDPDPFHILAPHTLTHWAEVALLECSGHAGWQVWGQDTQGLTQQRQTRAAMSPTCPGVPEPGALSPPCCGELSTPPTKRGGFIRFQRLPGFVLLQKYLLGVTADGETLAFWARRASEQAHQHQPPH